MRDLIMEAMNDICDEEGIDQDDLSDEEHEKLVGRAEGRVIDVFARDDYVKTT
ncbi:hypothetical protein ES708_00734 [subsurface metagenome]